MGIRNHIVLSTKEKGYVRKPAPKYQQLLAKLVYHDDKIVDDLRRVMKDIMSNGDKIAQLEKEGKALVLRPSKDIGVSRYTTDPKKLRPWFQLGYDETLARLDEIKEFIDED